MSNTPVSISSSGHHIIAASFARRATSRFHGVNRLPVAALIAMLVMAVQAAETEIPIPLGSTGGGMQAYLRFTNAGDTSIQIELNALDAMGGVLATSPLSIPAADTRSVSLRDIFSDLSETQIARVRVIHPSQVTVQLAFGAHPPDRPKAFSVPVG
jgi:hypothetical protein